MNMSVIEDKDHGSCSGCTTRDKIVYSSKINNPDRTMIVRYCQDCLYEISLSERRISRDRKIKIPK